MQRAAMNADFRIAIAGEFAACLAINELAEAVEEAAFAILDAGGEQFVADTEAGKFSHRMRQQRDADAEWFDFGRALVDAGFDAAPMQIERERQPANPAANDSHLHPFKILPFAAYDVNGRNRAIAVNICRIRGQNRF